MKIYKYGFIGHDESSTVLDWVGSDSKSNFTKNSQSMPTQWHYNHHAPTYVRNSLGHRSKEIDDLDFDNYILYVGCSHTEGIGVSQEHTFATLLSSKLNCDFYNMGVGSTGMDVTLHNLVIWFSVFNRKPKFVIIQWPDFTRVLTGYSSNFLRPNGLWKGNDEYNRFIDLGISLEYFESKKIMAHHIIKNMIDVPTVYFGLKGLVQFDDNTLIEKIIDNGRDLMHPGILSHRKFADSIYDHLINTECLSFYQNTEQKS